MAKRERVDVSKVKRYKKKFYWRRKRGKAPIRKVKRLSRHKPIKRKIDDYGRFV